MNGIFNDISDGPSVTIGAIQEDISLWFKGKANAVIVPGFNGAPGFGLLLEGTLMARNTSAAGRKGLMVPYCPNDYSAVGTDSRVAAGRTWLVSDGVAEATTVQVKIEDSFRFVVGDDLIIGDDTTDPEDLGAITEIDRTSNPAFATITVTTAVGATSFTVANLANIHVKCAAATPWMAAEGILTATMLTGIGPVAQSGMPMSVLVPGTQALNKNEIRNYDAAALTTLGMREVNAYMVL